MLGHHSQFTNLPTLTLFSDEDMFTEKIEPITYNGVANIGGNDIITKGIGTVIWYWNDYEGQLKTKRFYNLP